MIPLSLRLRNFLCYKGDAPTLDLEGVTVACLCGDNGHGKSALLDAVTWALWGKARGVPNPARGRTLDELIHYGENEMQVELTFRVRDERYRVTRRYARGKGARQGASDLQLQVWTGESYRAITGNTMSATQDRIQELIGMDYDTFINSAFLVQGRADEFTTKPPEKRKEVLAAIMGLGVYDRLEQRARERAGAAESSQRDAETQLVTLQKEIDQKPEQETALQDVQGKLAQERALLEAATREADALRLRVEDLRRRQGEAEELRKGIAQREATLSQMRQQAASHQSRIGECEAALAQRNEISAMYAELQSHRARLEALDSALSRHSLLQGKRAPLASAIQAQEATLREQLKALRARVDHDLAPLAARRPALEEQIVLAKQKLDALAGEQAALNGRRVALRELADRAGETRAELDRLKTEGQDLRAKLSVIERSPQGARCPLCNSVLGEDEYRHLAEGHRAAIAEKLAAFKQKEAQLKSLEAQRVQGEREVGDQETAIARTLREASRSASGLEHQLQGSKDAAQEMEGAQAQADALEARLKSGDFAQDEKKRLAELDAELTSLKYDAAEHASVRKSAQRLREYEEKHRRLLDAESALPGERDALARVEAVLARASEEQEAARKRLAEAQAAAGDLPAAERALKEAEARRAQSESRQAGFLAREGELNGRLKRIAEAEQASFGLSRKARELREEVALYRELAQAFGSRGVQAMLIESVLPDLEREANDLLARMTQNRMHVKLETQREARSKKGAEPIETLEIKIADELGTRAYELFSGGEAFRINLALRIALSRILAERSGAPLPTLFIDEGFGTQDAAGRESLVEVIRAIEPFFQKMLVITHLEEMKDAFPVRIEVRKTAEGSTFTVV